MLAKAIICIVQKHAGHRILVVAMNQSFPSCLKLSGKGRPAELCIFFDLTKVALVSEGM